jgi:HAMP domain-containing protein
LLIALWRAHSISRKLRYLATRADEISRGKLAASIEFKSRDEFGRLAEALERLRISMQEALERLRRRR